MGSLPNTKTAKRYRSLLVTMSLVYVVAILSSAYVLKHHQPGQVIAVMLAALPSIPILANMVIVGLYLKAEPDEFQRTVFQQCLLWGMGVTLALTSVWGLLEIFTRIPHVPIFFTFPAFWFFVGVATPFVRSRYRSSEADE